MALSNGFTLANAASFFKYVYANVDLTPLAVRDTPTLRMIPMQEAAQGKGIVAPINLHLPVGASATASDAVANAYGSRGKDWLLSTKNIYMRVNIDAKAMAVSRDRAAAYLEGKRKETDETLSYLGLLVEKQLWDDGSGYVGQAATLSGGPPFTSMTLAQPLDAINFHVNQVLIANTSRNDVPTPGTPHNDVYRVTSVNDVTGVIGIVRITDNSSAWTTNDYVFIKGMRLNVLSGIPSYIPASDPGVGSVPATLNGVDRTERPAFLSGWRGTNEGSIEESAKGLMSKMGRYMNKPASALWLSYANWRKLEQELGARAYRDEAASARFGTGAILLQTPKGDIPCVAGPYVPEDAGFFLDHSALKMWHLRQMFHMRDEDGLGAVRLDWSGDEDGIGIEFRSWPEFSILRPVSCGRFPIS